ncbi:MAG: hypothetical protein WAL59_09880 [Roseiarcus sp.]
MLLIPGCKVEPSKLLMLLIAGCEKEPSKLLVLTPSRAADPHEAIWLEVTVGPLPRGSRLSVTDEDGKLVGTITPFGATVGQTSLDYTLPLPKSDASGGPVRLRMEMLKPGDASRPPTPSEVLGVQLVYVPVSD